MKAFSARARCSRPASSALPLGRVDHPRHRVDDHRPARRRRTSPIASTFDRTRSRSTTRSCRASASMHRHVGRARMPRSRRTPRRSAPSRAGTRRRRERDGPDSRSSPCSHAKDVRLTAAHRSSWPEASRTRWRRRLDRAGSGPRTLDFRAGRGVDVELAGCRLSIGLAALGLVDLGASSVRSLGQAFQIRLAIVRPIAAASRARNHWVASSSSSSKKSRTGAAARISA